MVPGLIYFSHQPFVGWPAGLVVVGEGVDVFQHNTAGRACASTRVYACSRDASGSRPSRFHSSQKPDLENGVQGGPPTADPAAAPSAGRRRARSGQSASP